MLLRAIGMHRDVSVGTGAGARLHRAWRRGSFGRRCRGARRARRSARAGVSRSLRTPLCARDRLDHQRRRSRRDRARRRPLEHDAAVRSRAGALGRRTSSRIASIPNWPARNTATRAACAAPPGYGPPDKPADPARRGVCDQPGARRRLRRHGADAARRTGRHRSATGDVARRVQADRRLVGTRNGRRRPAIDLGPRFPLSDRIRLLVQPPVSLAVRDRRRDAVSLRRDGGVDRRSRRLRREHPVARDARRSRRAARRRWCVRCHRRQS